MGPLSKTDRDLLVALAVGKPDQIDLTVMGEITDWSEAEQGAFFRPARFATPVGLDSELVAWFRLSGPGFQARMEAVLRAHMQTQIARRDGRPKPTMSQANALPPRPVLEASAASTVAVPAGPGRIRKLFAAEPGPDTAEGRSIMKTQSR